MHVQREIHRLSDLNEFLLLSGSLSLQFAAKNVGPANTLALILNRRQTTPRERTRLLEVLEYVRRAYGDRRRRLGSPAFIHPIRSAALLSRVVERPSMLDLATILLHDKLEDIGPEHFEDREWEELEETYESLAGHMEDVEAWYLKQRVDWLTRRDDVTYASYLGRLLDQSDQTPELLRIKLADRLDNTLDMRITIADPLEGVDFFECLFELLFVNRYQGYAPGDVHPPKVLFNGANRLYQLFKNTVVLSMVRQTDMERQDTATGALFEALARASVKEAQRIVHHIFGYHMTDVRDQREFLLEAMAYAQSGGMERATLPNDTVRLDGLFIRLFEHENKAVRKQKLAELYEDKPMMVEAAIAFMVIFLSFLNDPAYSVQNVGREGVKPAQA
jgi:hypothetical protein